MKFILYSIPRKVVTDSVKSCLKLFGRIKNMKRYTTKMVLKKEAEL